MSYAESKKLGRESSKKKLSPSKQLVFRKLLEEKRQIVTKATLKLANDANLKQTYSANVFRSYLFT